MAARRSSTPSAAAVVLAMAMAMAAAIAVVRATDPDPLQDFCVADLQSEFFVNGFPCKDPATITTEDFAFAGMTDAGPFNPISSAAVKNAKVRDWPALNTLGLSLNRLDLKPGGYVPPHTHNLATEIFLVLEGEIATGFVANRGKDDGAYSLLRQFPTVVKTGEAFLIPRGLMHYQINKGNTTAVSINVFNAQSSGAQLIPAALFATDPPIEPRLLARSFFINTDEVEELRAAFAPPPKK